jgi:hypothetical protein
MLGAASIPMSAIPIAGDITGLASDAAMYSAYPEERTMGNYAMSALGVLPLVPGAAALRAARGTASPLEGVVDAPQEAMIKAGGQDSFTVYQGTPHVFGANQLVRNIETGKEYVSDPAMAKAISTANPDKYELIQENPLGIFDLNRLGTGEGAQAYGSGIYTAESPDVGRFYRGSLLERSGIDDTLMVGSKPVADLYSEIEQRASRLSGNASAKEYDKLAILEQIMIDGDILGVMQNKEYFSPEAFDWFNKNISTAFSRPGALYEAQINAPRSLFLDWDKPVVDQSPEVLERLQRAGIYDPEIEYKLELLNNQRHILARDRDPVTNAIRNESQWHEITKEMDDLRRKQLPYMTGQQAYYAAAPNSSQAEASRVLRELGIPGVSYLDQTSRMAGAGSRNYVLFDPKIANITARYGAAGGAVGLSALRQLMPQEEERPIE